MTRNAIGLVCVLAAGCQQDRTPPTVEVAVAVAKPVPAPVVTKVVQPAPVPTPPQPPTVAIPMQRHPPVPVPRPTLWFRKLPSAERKHVAQVCAIYAKDPCYRIRRFSDDHPDPTVELLADLTDEQKEGVGAYCEQVNRGRRGCNTPLVLAFDDHPIALVPATATPFAFQAGAPVASDWPTAATPCIALDRDGDGQITSGAELFGDATLAADGTLAHDGFAALAALDANGDGALDASDPAFAALLLWTDRDGDRRSSPDELRPLSSVVTRIPLAHSRDARCDARGNCEGERGTWRDVFGGEHPVVDLYLRAR